MCAIVALGDHTYYGHHPAPQSLATICFIIAILITTLYVGAESFISIIGTVTSYLSNTLGLLWFVLLKVTIRLWYGFRQLHYAIRQLSRLVIVITTSKFFRQEILTLTFIRILSEVLPISYSHKSMVRILLEFINLISHDWSFFDCILFGYALITFLKEYKTTLDLVIDHEDT